MTDEPALMGFIAWVVDGGRHREGARAMLGQCRRSAPDSGTGPTVAEPVKKLKDIKACNVIFFAHPRSMITRGAG